MTHHRHDLEWYFGPGSAQFEPHGDTMSAHRDGLWSKTPGGACFDPDPNGDNRIKWGRISRVVATLSREHQEILALAYGAEGVKATKGGLHRSRWLAVAPLAPSAIRWALQWVKTKPPQDGHPVARWLAHMKENVAAHWVKKPEDPERWRTVRTEAEGMLRSAIDAYEHAAEAQEDREDNQAHVGRQEAQRQGHKSDAMQWESWRNNPEHFDE
jgi:hypothetical protein